MIVFPNAKINLGLHVTSKRPDGFHNIETVFYPLELFDIIEVIPEQSAGITSFTTSGLKIPGDKKENLCLKAWSVMQKKYGLPHSSIHLHKKIPFGSGLGGGSSDATHVILLANQIFGLELSQEELIKVASLIGSDCAFFVLNKPVFAMEKGHQFTQTEVNLSGYYLQLVVPQVHVDTKHAYSLICPEVPEISLLKKIGLPVSEWKDQITNDFEGKLFQLHPELKQVKEEFYNSGAIYASMSGSGSAIFGLFEKKPDLPGFFENYFTWGQQF